MTPHPATDPRAPTPTELLSASHYRQVGHRQPDAGVIGPSHEVVELLTGGRGWIEHEGREVQVTEGALLWHTQGQRTISRTDPDDPYRCLALRWRIQAGQRPPVPRISWWAEMDRVTAFTREVVGLFVDERFDRRTLLCYAYGRLRFQADLYHRLSPEPDLPAALATVQRLIDRHFAQPLTIQDLADSAQCSAAHLHALFKQYFGQTPHQALIARRLRAAREQLASTNAPIKQVARDCGFTDAGSLCRRFGQTMGVTPAVYRKRNQARS